jgi:hypothetical protein
MTPNEPGKDWAMDALFKILDHYGVSMVVVLLLVLLVWKVSPELVKVWVDKIRAETEVIRKTGDAVSEKIPQALGELRTAHLAGMSDIKTAHVEGMSEIKVALTNTETRVINTIQNTVAADTDRRIVEHLQTIERRVSRHTISDAEFPAQQPPSVQGPQPPPPVRGKLPSRSG